MAKGESRRRRAVIELNMSNTVVTENVGEGSVRPNNHLRRTGAEDVTLDSARERGKKRDDVRVKADQPPGHVIDLDGPEYEVLLASLKCKERGGAQVENTHRESYFPQLSLKNRDEVVTKAKAGQQSTSSEGAPFTTKIRSTWRRKTRKRFTDMCFFF